jgi:DNA-binding transcriptional ArsR family regulator
MVSAERIVGSPARLRVLLALSDLTGFHSSYALARKAGMAPADVRSVAKVLTNHGLLTSQQVGRSIRYCLAPEHPQYGALLLFLRMLPLLPDGLREGMHSIFGRRPLVRVLKLISTTRKGLSVRDIIAGSGMAKKEVRLALHDLVMAGLVRKTIVQVSYGTRGQRRISRRVTGFVKNHGHAFWRDDWHRVFQGLWLRGSLWLRLEAASVVTDAMKRARADLRRIHVVGRTIL